MHRHVNAARLLGHSPADRLPDPPCGIGAEATAACRVKLLRGANQAQIALLHQIEQGNALVHVAFGDAHHQAQVGLHQLLQRLRLTGHHAPRQSQLLLRRQQRGATDLGQILAQRVIKTGQAILSLFLLQQ
jgi:hypothetical protein